MSGKIFGNRQSVYLHLYLNTILPFMSAVINMKHSTIVSLWAKIAWKTEELFV